MKIVGATCLGGLWALERRGTLLKQTCAAQESQELPIPSIVALIVSEIPALIRTDGTLLKQTCAAQESQESASIIPVL